MSASTWKPYDEDGETDRWSLDAEWLPLRDLDDGSWLTSKPPERRFLLRARHGGTEVLGAMPMGRVGMLAAAGGAGKSWLLTQLALAVATGCSWLDTFDVVEPGRVLIVMAEEERTELRRRLAVAVRLLGLTDDQIQTATSRLVVMPLVGHDVRLVGGDGRRTRVFDGFRDKLRGTTEPWRLLIFDPLSRFAGPDAEKDNAAGTATVEAFEQLADVPGAPAVVVAHHTSRAARREGHATARGSTSLEDGFRWVMGLEPLRRKVGGQRHPLPLDRFVSLCSSKQNYSAAFSPIPLRRSAEHEGALRRAEHDELEAATADHIRGERVPKPRRTSAWDM